MDTKSLSRRELLHSTGALVVGFNLMGWVNQTEAQVPDGAASSPYDNPDYLDPTSLDSWLAVMPDGHITVYTGKVDLGTGVETALAQIAADELDVPFDRIHMAMGDTAKTVDQGRTAGSQTLMRAGPQLRQAAAAGRQQLLKLAAAQLGSPAEMLTVRDGVVMAANDPARKVAYGDLLGGKRFNVTVTAKGLQWAMVVAPDVPAKSYKDYKVVGQSIPRVELPKKLTGEFTYTPDVRVPGMLHGRAVRPATVLSKPASVDESSIRHIAGVVKVVREGSFVGVVAQTEWATIQAAKTLKVTWSEPAKKLQTPQEIDEYLKTAKSSRDLMAVDKGNVEAALAQSGKKFEAAYHWPFQMHGMMGPSCAVADVRGDKVTVWTGSQGPFTTRDRIAAMLKVPKRNVSVIFAEGSGCYGRLTADDAAEDAVLLSRAVAKPVRVQWMREDEHVWSPKGPQQLMTARAAVNDQGKIVAWDYLDRGFPWSESQGTPQLAERQIGAKTDLLGNPNGVGGGGEYYEIEHHRVAGAVIAWPQDDPSPLRTCALRSPGEPPRNFGSECFLDEIAADLRVDPVQFRLRHLTNSKRIGETLVAAAQKAGWKERPSPAPASVGSKASGRGVALSVRNGTIIAAVAEVEVDKTTGKVVVKKVTVAHDCGLIVNPDGLRFQIDGNVMQGVSRALLEEVKFDATGVQSQNWATYPVLRFREIPEVEAVLIDRPELPPTGGAEPAIIVIPAAIGNAIFDAVGVRLRQVPFTPERVLNAMQSKASSPARA